jgi:tRNA U34 5-methylaminomethyl-2-thiouridine-forming methyltransferase MnmC
MKREIIVTEDGSHSVSIPDLNVTYHSIHGAIQESKHVFIEAGLNYLLDGSSDEQITILEVGFGTGLNALLTAIEAKESTTSIYYLALEPFPISAEEANSLNYCERLEQNDFWENFKRMHECEWNTSLVLTENILMHKSNYSLQELGDVTKFNIIYYDAFAPSAQPELWTREIFQKLFHLLKPNGILVTYCSKGDVRRAMVAAGFDVEKLPGPPGKREMIRAIKGLG